MTDTRLDETDRAILDYIQRHGRAAYAEIGTHAGLSVSAVNERLIALRDYASAGRPALTSAEEYAALAPAARLQRAEEVRYQPRGVETALLAKEA